MYLNKKGLYPPTMEIKTEFDNLINKINNTLFGLIHSVPKMYISSNQCKTSYGCCYHNYEDKIIISVSKYTPITNIKEVLLHEITHAILGSGNGHGKLFHIYFSNLTKSLDIKGIYSSRTLKIDSPLDGKYILQCCKCNTNTYFHRKAKSYCNYKLYRCKCGGELKQLIKENYADKK